MDKSRFKVEGYPVKHKAKIPFNPLVSLNVDLRAKIAEIESLDRELGGFLLSGEDYMELAREAYASNIHWSTKIEGSRVSMDEVRELARRYTFGDLRESSNGPTQEILNHLGSVFDDTLFRMPWSIDTVKRVHAILMDGVGQTEPGRIRETEVSVYGSDGTELFRACPADHVVRELESLVEWLNNSPYESIVTASLFFHEFESIHPFEDGNGRTGRVLFQAVLRELGLTNCSLCKFEERLLGDTETYYDLLTYIDSVRVYTPLVEYIIDSLLQSYRDAVSVFSEKDRLSGMDENSRALALKARSAKEFFLKDAVSWVSIGERSVKNKLDELVEMDILSKEGRTRGMRYVFRDPFRDVREQVREMHSRRHTS